MDEQSATKKQICRVIYKTDSMIDKFYTKLFSYGRWLFPVFGLFSICESIKNILNPVFVTITGIFGSIGNIYVSTFFLYLGLIMISLIFYEDVGSRLTYMFNEKSIITYIFYILAIPTTMFMLLNVWLNYNNYEMLKNLLMLLAIILIPLFMFLYLRSWCPKLNKSVNKV